MSDGGQRRTNDAGQAMVPVASGGRGAEIAAMAKGTLSALLALVPRAAWRGVKGGLAGLLLGGLLGLAAAGGASLLLDLPGWLGWVQVLWVPFALSLGGAYIGAINGMLSALTDELERQGLAARLYGLVKPACVAAAQRLASRAPGRGGAAEVSGALREELEQRLGEGGEPAPPSLGGRVERYLALRSRSVLCFSAVRAIGKSKDPVAARAELESLGVERLQAWMVETVEDLFLGQLILAGAVSLLAAALPALIYAIAIALGA